jgi:hypothetical protein
MKLSRAVIFIFLLFLMSSLGFSRNDLYILGKINFMGATGSEDSYKEGENDFPVASSFSTMGFGLGFTTSIKPVFFGLEAHYNLSGTTILTDTSDNDTVKINTYKYASGFLTLGVDFLKNQKLALFMNTGIGLSYALNPEMKTYVSQYGYETEIEPPEKKYFLTAFAGLGLKIYFNPVLGFLLNTRYQYMDQEEPQSAICLSAGIVYTF